MRLDTQIVEQGLTNSREKARALIMAGKVQVDGKPAEKPGMEVKEASKIEIIADPIPFVSRGGLKLKKAIEEFSISLQDTIDADIGASTGGFTDCMLQNGAKKIYALDVGYGQLDWRLRNDPRVVVMERTNARYMEPCWYDEPLQFASIDVSFISLRLILPPLHPCLSAGAQVVALIKPQFEAGRRQVEKHGVVKDFSVHVAVIDGILDFALHTGFHAKRLSFSPVTGPKGNIEFLLLLEKSCGLEARASAVGCNVTDIVEQAHSILRG